jgi:hypothetical protein
MYIFRHEKPGFEELQEMHKASNALVVRSVAGDAEPEQGWLRKGDHSLKGWGRC